MLSQSMPDFELLLIGQQDVGSLIDHAPVDHRIRVIARRRPGIVGALNTGLSVAKGRYIARMDDDDIARPERLQLQLDHLRGPAGTELCGGLIRFIDSEGNSETIRHGNREYARWLNSLVENHQIHQACFVECPMPHPTWMADRQLWQRLGLYCDADLPEDYELLLRARLQGIRMGKPAQVILDWREHAERLTYRDRRYRREAFAECRASALVDPRSQLGLQDGRRVWICGTGRSARQWHDSLQSRGVRINGFVDLHRHGPQRSKRQLPVISYEQLVQQRREALVITAVAGESARSRLTDWFAERGWLSGREFILGA